MLAVEPQRHIDAVELVVTYEKTLQTPVFVVGVKSVPGKHKHGLGPLGTFAAL